MGILGFQINMSKANKMVFQWCRNVNCYLKHIKSSAKSFYFQDWKSLKKQEYMIKVSLIAGIGMIQENTPSSHTLTL